MEDVTNDNIFTDNGSPPEVVEDVQPDNFDLPSQQETDIQQSTDEWQIGVSDPQTRGEGMSQHHVYNITIHTTNNRFSKNQWTIVRRFSDFEWVRARLAEQFRMFLVPPIPEKSISNRMEKEFVTYRRRELERFLKRVLSVPSFLDSPELRAFLETQTDDFSKHKDSLNTSQDKKKKQGWLSYFTEKVQNVQQAMGTPKEVDEWFEKEKGYLDSLESQYSILLSKSNAVTRRGRELTHIWNELAQISGNIADIETSQDKRLSIYFNKFAEIAVQISSLEKECAENENEFFDDSIKDYLRVIGAAKDLLANRAQDLWIYQSATKSLDTKREKLAKNDGSSVLLQEVDEAQLKETESKAQFEKISESCKSELDGFMKAKTDEVGSALRRLVQTNMNFHLRVVDLWKEYLSLIEDHEPH